MAPSPNPRLAVGGDTRPFAVLALPLLAWLLWGVAVAPEVIAILAALGTVAVLPLAIVLTMVRVVVAVLERTVRRRDPVSAGATSTESATSADD